MLIRYARYNNVYDGEVENSGEDFWDRYDGFYRECRSLVIDVVNDCIILAPYKKFFNIGEVEETSLENVRARINTAKCIEFSNKLDGSMQSVTWYNGEIVMAGSQMPDPELSWRLADGYRMINSKNCLKMFTMQDLKMEEEIRICIFRILREMGNGKLHVAAM